MLSATGEKLSKRHGAVSALEYRDAGYSPVAVLNYLARFGWAHGNQEVFSLKELVDAFSWEACGKNDGRFDVKKFAAIQYEHLKRIDLTNNEQYAHGILPLLYKAGFENLNHKQIERLIPLVRTRSKTFIEAAQELDPILRKDILIDEQAAKNIFTPDAKQKLQLFYAFLSTMDSWNEASLRTATQDWLTASNMTLKDIGQPSRLAIVGKTNSPELFQVMDALGKDTTLTRISKQI
jgi:glutamyl-tRNA synthetase